MVRRQGSEARLLLLSDGLIKCSYLLLIPLFSDYKVISVLNTTTIIVNTPSHVSSGPFSFETTPSTKPSPW